MNAGDNTTAGITGGAYISKAGKMEQSCLTFKHHHPDWTPPKLRASQYLNTMMHSNLGYDDAGAISIYQF
jgi:hypothetical protein